MIPRLERSFGRMLQLHAQIRQHHERLSQAGFAPTGEEFEVSPPGATLAVRSDLASLRTLIDAIRQELLDLSQVGCVVKSIDSGLVDWHASLDGRDIYLCWKLGEKKVAYWHEIEAGYAGRRPVSELKVSTDGYASENRPGD